MTEMDDESWRIRASLGIFESCYRFGNTKALRNWIVRKKNLFESDRAKEAYQTWEIRCTQMENFENVHGEGSCLQLENPEFEAFILRHKAFFPTEFLERARKARYSIAVDFAPWAQSS
jgi:hypothetical protein